MLNNSGINDALKSFQPQFSNLFELEIVDKDVSNPYKFNDSFKFRVKSADFNLSKLKTEQTFYGVNYYTGVEISNSINLRILESEKFDTLQYFQYWLDQIYIRPSPQQGGITGQNFVFKSFLNQQEYEQKCEKTFILKFTKPTIGAYPVSGLFAENMYITFYGVKLLGNDGLSLTYEDGNPLSYQVNFVFNAYKLTPISV